VIAVKILQIAPYYTPTYGGQERYIYNLSKCLIKNGHEVHILTSDFPQGQRDDLTDGIGISRHRCLARVLGNPIMPGMLLDINLMRQYDVLHVHNEHSFSAIVADILKNSVDKPMLLTCHGQLKFGNSLKDSIEQMYSRTIGKNIIQKADRIIVLSESDRSYVSSFGIKSDKFSILPNAIDPVYYEDLVKKASLLPGDSEGPNLLENKRIVLFVGPVVRRKGVEYLLKAIPEIVRTIGTDVVFVIVGDGEYLQSAKMLAKSLGVERYILFTGLVPETDLVMYYQHADLFVLPSLSEGLPTSILEAMYFKLPVVATDIPGIRDHFKHSALLVKPADERELAKAIMLVLNDIHIDAGLLEARKENITQNYIWEKVAREYERIYVSMISSHAKSKSDSKSV